MKPKDNIKDLMSHLLPNNEHSIYRFGVFFPCILDIQKWAQTPLLIYTMVSLPYNINLDGEINDFQARSDGYCLVTPQLTSFASQNLTQLKRQCRTGAFSVTDGFASILFQSLMLKYVSHYSWLQADRICYPRLLPLFFSLLKCTNMEVLGGGCSLPSIPAGRSTPR